MSDPRIPPHDVQAEAALLGCCLLSPQALSDVVGLVLAEDFYKPAHQFVWSAIVELWASGQPVDALTVAGVLTDAGMLEDIGGGAMLLDLQTDTPAISNVKAYSERVIRTSRLRAAISAASEILDLVYDGVDPDNVVDKIGLLADDHRLLPRSVTLPAGLTTMRDFLEEFAKRSPEEQDDWLVPGLLRRRHRILLVGAEGSAKTFITRMIAMCVANGVHPFAPGHTVTERKVLMIDCENPDDIIIEQTNIIDQKTGLPLSETDNLMVWRQPAGLDLRAKRRDQAQFEAVLQAVKPDLVTLGPIYKIYSNERDLEDSAKQLFDFLDGMRTRFGFTLIMEHHAPKGQNGQRELAPFGTVAWQRWPEMGIRFKPSEFDSHRHPHKLEIDRFRGDRSASVVWPTILTRSNSPTSMTPWVATYETGTWNTPKDPGPVADEGSEPF